jgi:diaminopimelate epimerase
VRNAFFKGHGLGNDYIAVDPAELDFGLTPKRVRRLCDRHTGVGSDGLLALAPSRKADFGLRIWNPDGSEAEKSGNGLRIFARWLHATRRTKKRSFSVETN